MCRYRGTKNILQFCLLLLWPYQCLVLTVMLVSAGLSLDLWPCGSDLTRKNPVNFETILPVLISIS